MSIKRKKYKGKFTGDGRKSQNIKITQKPTEFFHVVIQAALKSERIIKMTKKKPKKKKKIENCNICGGLMNLTKDKAGNKTFLCKGQKEPYPHTTKSWVLK